MAQITAEQRALVVALELLRDQVQQSALATAANTQRMGALITWHAHLADQFANGAASGMAPPGGAIPTATPVATPVIPTATPVASVVETAEQRQRRQEKQAEKRREDAGQKARDDLKRFASPMTSVFSMVGAKFAAVAAPLAILAQVLGSATSGFQTLGKATNLLASVLAPVLLPATLLLSTGIVAMSSILTDVGMPALSSFFDLMIDGYLPAIMAIIEGMQVAAEMAASAADAMKGLSDAALFVIGAIHGRPTDRARDRTASAMSDVMASLRMSIGPKAQMSGLGDVGRSVQMAALNADPLEARLMRQQLQVLERIEAAVARRRELDNNPRLFDPVRAGAEFTAGLFDDVRAVARRLGI